MEISKIKEGYLKNRLIYNCVLLLCLFFVNCFWANAIYIVYPILLLLVLIDGLDKGFSYIIFTIPYCLLKPHTSVLLFFICIFAYILKFSIDSIIKKKISISKSSIILIGIFAIYCLLPIGEYRSNLFIKTALLLSIFAVILLVCNRSEVFKVEQNFKLLAVSLMISCLFSFTYYISPYAHMLFEGKNLGGGRRYTALFDNPNILAMLCEILLPVLCYYIMSRKSKLWELLLVTMVAVIGCCALSKTFYIILLFVIFALFIWKLKTNYKKTLIIAGIVLAGVGLFAIFKPESFVHIWDRFFGEFRSCKSFEDFMNMVTTNRYSLWTIYGSNMLGAGPLRWLFGFGLGARPLGIYGSHNAYLGMFYQLGLVGSALFIGTLILIFKQLKKQNKIQVHKAIWLPLLVIMMIFMVEDVIFFMTF